MTTDERTVDGKRRVDITVTPGPMTEVTSLSLNFKGPVLTEAPERERATRGAWTLREGSPFSQEAWGGREEFGAQGAAGRALPRRTHHALRGAHQPGDPTRRRSASSSTAARPLRSARCRSTAPGATPAWIITNVNPLNLGEIYTSARIDELQKQIQSTPYFASVALDVGNDPAHPDLTPIRLKVSEYPYQSMRTSLG